MSNDYTKVFRLYVTAENEAFNGPTEGERYEISRILRECADKIDREGVGFASETVRDINGNDVGRYALKMQQQWDH